MLMFVLIGLSLVLLGVVGLQFTYMFYVERMYNERRKHMHALENKAKSLARQLKAAQKQLAEQDELLRAYPGLRKDDEVWAEVIDER